jgi:hypothetical protein
MTIRGKTLFQYGGVDMKKLTSTLLFALVLSAGSVLAADKPEHSTYSKNEVLQEVENFFGEGAEGLAEVVEKAFEDHGRPNAYIAGDEVAAAVGIGVRYGKGYLQTRSGRRQEVHWQGPSIGFDAGADAAKVFVLIYNLERPTDIFQRYPGVEGSLYFVGGVGMNYLGSGDTVLAPLRLGAGWRQGVNVGYMDFTREASVIPF